MIGIRLVCVGKLKERFYIGAADEYVKRLGAYCKIEVIELPEFRLPASPSAAEIERALMSEAQQISAKLQGASHVIAMCIEGQMMDSAELSAHLAGRASGGDSRIAIVIGGSYGLHGSIKEKAGLRLSMSRMTFPHSFARVMLLEQVYRAFKIAEGGKYHK